MAVRKAGAKGASNPYEPRLPGETRGVIMMAFSSRAFVHDDEAAAPHDPVARRFRCITSGGSPAGPAPRGARPTEPIPPARSGALAGYLAVDSPGTVTHSARTKYGPP